MEGTTLSFGETKELLEHGNTAGDKPLSEQLVILGFAKAYDVIIREATNPVIYWLDSTVRCTVRALS